MSFRTGERKDGSSYYYPLNPRNNSYNPPDLDVMWARHTSEDCVEKSERLINLMREIRRADEETKKELISGYFEMMSDIKTMCPEFYKQLELEKKEFDKVLGPNVLIKYDEYFDIENEPDIKDFTNEDLISAIRNVKYDANSAKEEIEKLKIKKKLTNDELNDLDNWEDMLTDSVIELGNLTEKAKKRGLKID